MIKDFFNGISSYFSAFQIISKLRLWKYFLVPIVISLLVAGGLGVALGRGAGGFHQHLRGGVPENVDPDGSSQRQTRTLGRCA